MNDSSQAVTAMIGLWLMLQLAVLLALLLGGLYALYCLSRAASGLDRLAGAMEEWVQRENAKSAPPLPGVSSLERYVPGSAHSVPTPPVPPTPPSPAAISEIPLTPILPTTDAPPTDATHSDVKPIPPTPPQPTPPDFIDEAFGEARRETVSQSPAESPNQKPEEKREF